MLPRRDQLRVRAKIDALAEDPRPPGAVKLSGGGSEEQYRIRAGHYRIIYEIQEQVLLVLVVRVGHRSEVYRRLDRLKK